MNDIFAVNGFERAAKYYEGFGILGLKGRVEFLGLALQKIPNLKERIFHAYGLARCFESFPEGVGKVVEKSLAYEEEVQNMKETIELYARTRGSIPPKTLARLKDQGVIKKAKYNQYSFEARVERLVSWYILRERWDEVGILAKIGSLGL